MKNKIISPSLLSANFLNLEDEFSYLNKIAGIWIHLDIMDGHFVPNLTFGYPVVANLHKLTTHPLDAHLMVNCNELVMKQLATCKIHNITFHIESIASNLSLLDQAKKLFPSVGISLKPNTDFNLIPQEVLKKIDLILLMSVNPGFSGQSFMENVYEKISAAHKFKMNHNPKLEIQIDGGISNLNSHQLFNVGASNLVTGSHLFKQEKSNYLSTITEMRN